jgi:hypothetical protein
MQQSPLDMAKRLKQTSLRKIAAEVAHLNDIPVPQPLSLRKLLALFANVAKPKVPDVTDIFNFGRVDWKDAGAGTFRFATLYHAKFQMEVDGDWFLAYSGWTTDTAWVTQEPLGYDLNCKTAVVAWNEWGHSDTNWISFTSGDNPNPPQPSPKPTPPPQGPHPSGIQFYNCGDTPMSENPHLPVLFHLRNVTTNGAWQFWQINSGYDASGACGTASESGPFTVPGLTEGDTYQWVVTMPDDPECSDSSTGPTDPNHCPVFGPGTVTIGSDTVLVLQYPPV